MLELSVPIAESAMTYLEVVWNGALDRDARCGSLVADGLQSQLHADNLDVMVEADHVPRVTRRRQRDGDPDPGLGR